MQLIGNSTRTNGVCLRAYAAPEMFPFSVELAIALRIVPVARTDFVTCLGCASVCHFRILGCSMKSSAACRRWATSIPRRSSSALFPSFSPVSDMMGSAQTGTGKTAAFGAADSHQAQAQHGRMPRASSSSRRANSRRRSRRLFAISRASWTSESALVHGGVGFGKQREQLQAGRGCARGDARPAARFHRRRHRLRSSDIAVSRAR